MLNRQSIRVVPFAALIAAMLTLSGCGVNNIPTYEQSAKAAWSEVLNQYKRRSDLIPNLAQVGQRLRRPGKERADRGHQSARADDEKTFQLPARHSDQPRRDEEIPGRPGDPLGGALRAGLWRSSERYPDIKSGQNFLALQSELAGTENRITIARRDYIGTVQAYNTEINDDPWPLVEGVPVSTIQGNGDVRHHGGK